MGYMRHHVIVVNSWHPELLAEARAKAIAIFGGVAPISEILASPVNREVTFIVGPDGSKEGWDASDTGDALRELFCDWLDAQRYEDGSSWLLWAEVVLGADNDEDTGIARHRGSTAATRKDDGDA